MSDIRKFNIALLEMAHTIHGDEGIDDLHRLLDDKHPVPNNDNETQRKRDRRSRRARDTDRNWFMDCLERAKGAKVHFSIIMTEVGYSNPSHFSADRDFLVKAGKIEMDVKGYYRLVERAVA